MSPIRLLIADDHGLFRAGLARICARAGMDIVGEARDGLEAVALAERLKPDLTLMDIRMPMLDGIAATERLIAGSPEARVIVLTMEQNDRSVLAALRAGARGYLLKDASEKTLLEAIRSVHRGERWLAAPLADLAVAELQRLRAGGTRPEPEALTEHELIMLRLLAQGKDNHAIAEELGLAHSTVGNRISVILRKLNVNNRTQAALEALRRGLASLDDPE